MLFNNYKENMLAMCVGFIHLSYILSNDRDIFHEGLLSHRSSVMDTNNREIAEFHCNIIIPCLIAMPYNHYERIGLKLLLFLS